MRKDNYMTATQVAEFLHITKHEVKELVAQNKLTAIKADPQEARFLLSMREVNKFAKKVANKNN